ncbi:MAG: hypothetical protein AB8G77_11615 [Rhodothermales bacterium]
MPYRYNIDPKQQLVNVAFFGTVDGVDVNKALSEIFFDKDWCLSFDHCWDGSGVTKLDFEYGQFKGIKNVLQRLELPEDIVHGKMAVIVSNRIAYVVVRAAHAVFNAYKPFAIFQNRAHATIWLEQGKQRQVASEQFQSLWQSA